VPIEVVPVARPDLRELYEAHLALVRPDQVVAWRGSDPDAGVEAAALAAGLL